MVMDNLLMVQQDKDDNDDRYITINKRDIDKVYGIIMELPDEQKWEIIYTWLASESNLFKWIYDSHADWDRTSKEMEVMIDSVKEILTHDAPQYEDW